MRKNQSSVNQRQPKRWTKCLNKAEKLQSTLNERTLIQQAHKGWVQSIPKGAQEAHSVPPQKEKNNQELREGNDKKYRDASFLEILSYALLWNWTEWPPKKEKVWDPQAVHAYQICGWRVWWSLNFVYPCPGQIKWFSTVGSHFAHSRPSSRGWEKGMKDIIKSNEQRCISLWIEVN